MSATRQPEPTPRGPLMDMILVGGAALVVRMVYLLEFSRSPFFDFLHLDPRYYHDWAVEIASGNWLGKEVFEQSPLYPYLLAVYFLLFGKGLFLLRVIQFAVGSLTAALTCLLGRKVFSRGAGIAAGLGAAIYGPFLFYEGQVMKEFLTPFFSVTMLLLFYGALEDRAGGRKGRGRARFALAGLSIGLAALVRDNFLLVLPVLAGCAALAPWRAAGADEAGSRTAPAPEGAPSGATPPRLPRREKEARGRLLDAAALIAGALIALLPVAARNYAIAGEWVLTTSGGGEVFYIGNGPYANGAYVPPPWVRANPRFEHEDFRRKAREIAGRNLTRPEASRFWYREGLRTILDDPLRWARLLARKALLFLNDHELPDNYSFSSFRRFSWVLVFTPTFGWIAAFAAPGLIASSARWRELIPFYLAGGGYMASVMLFFNFARFRLPFIPILLVFAGHGAIVLGRALWSLRPRGGAPSWRNALLYGGAAAVAAAGTLVDLSSKAEEPFGDRLHLAAAYQQAGRSAESEQVLRETIRDAEALLARHGWRPGSPSVPGGITYAIALHAAHRDLAAVLIEQKRTDEGIREMESAIPLDPNDADLFQRLGDAYRSKGDLRSAARAFERGLAVAPSSFTIRFDLATALYESGDAASALRQLLEAKASNPALSGLDLADWHYGMGTVLLALPGREGEAREHLREALKENPDHPQAAEVRSLLSSPG